MQEGYAGEIRCPHCGKTIEPGDDFAIVKGEFVCRGCLDEKYVKCRECGEYLQESDAIRCETDGGYYCNECAERKLTRCDDCGGWFRGYDVTWIGDFIYCDSCRDRDFAKCYACGEYVPNGEYTEIGGEYFCRDCARDYVECEGCSNPVRRDDAYETHYGDRICPGCYDSDYFTCNDCGEVFHVDDSVEIDGSYYCQSCAEERDDEDGHGVMSYHGFGNYYGRRLDDENDEKLLLGVELEVERGSIDTSDFDPWLDDGNLIHFEHDSSLNSGGVECISQPCTLRFHQKKMKWPEICDILKSQGFRSSFVGSNCGLHVHFSRYAVTPLTIVKMDVFVNRAYPLLWQIARRKDFFGSHYDVGKTAKKEKGEIRGGHDDRYVAVNTTNYSTVEIRIFKGTLCVETLLGTVELVHAMIKFLEFVPITKIYETSRNISNLLDFIAEKHETYPHVLPMMRRLVKEGDFVKKIGTLYGKYIKAEENQGEN